VILVKQDAYQDSEHIAKLSVNLHDCICTQ